MNFIFTKRALTPKLTVSVCVLHNVVKGGVTSLLTLAWRARPRSTLCSSTTACSLSSSPGLGAGQVGVAGRGTGFSTLCSSRSGLGGSRPEVGGRGGEMGGGGGGGGGGGE